MNRTRIVLGAALFLAAVYFLPLAAQIASIR